MLLRPVGHLSQYFVLFQPEMRFNHLQKKQEQKVKQNSALRLATVKHELTSSKHADGLRICPTIAQVMVDGSKRALYMFDERVPLSVPRTVW